MMRRVTITFIGDIHGWSDRLERVLAQAEGSLVFVGDLFDRGPDAPGVLRRVSQLCFDGRARCLMGNHEYALLRSLGAEIIALEPDPDFFAAWRDGFGGDAVLAAFGVEDADGLRARLGPLIDWLALLPWVLEGEEGGRRWIAVHAGLSEEPMEPQLEQLRAGWRALDYPPESLFSKSRRYTVPRDLPPRCCIVSGHTPMAACFVSEFRILCDTSGGLRDRQLSGVIWPEGRVISG
jgi:hypothetical protein